MSEGNGKALRHMVTSVKDKGEQHSNCRAVMRLVDGKVSDETRQLLWALGPQ